jgi:hypothetical protein
MIYIDFEQFGIDIKIVKQHFKNIAKKDIKELEKENEKFYFKRTHF